MMESNYVEFTSLHNRYLLPYKLRRAIRRKILRAYLNQISEGKARIETIEIPAYRNIARIFERFDTFPILIPRIPYPSPFPSLLREFFASRNLPRLRFSSSRVTSSPGYPQNTLPYTSLRAT